MADIKVAGSLIPSTIDTPLDKRERVATLADVASIENPALGGIFYCIETGKHYKITSLKSKMIGPATVANAQVDSYEELVQVDSSLAGRVSDVEEALEGKADSEVTKFEVFATDAVIPAGTVDADTGLAYAVDVPAGMTHTFKLRSDTLRIDQDVVIEWGDGASSNLRSGEYDEIDDSEFNENGELVYTVSHTYATPGKYIVTINGKEYWGFQTKGDVADTPSILSRIFAADLPVASCVTNLSLAARGTLKLQSVLIPTGMDLFSNVNNASCIFMYCKNLLSVTNMATKFQYTRYVQQMFHSCENLETCDFRIPPNSLKGDGSRQVFYNCKKLTANIANLLPERGFAGAKLNFLECFKNCESLTGSVPASILWGDKSIQWINTANVFAGCSDEIRAQVPVSWGGTAPEEIIGGYSARILTYDASTRTVWMDPDGDVDWTKFQKDQIVRISLPDADTEAYLSGKISTVDSVNSKLVLSAALNLASGTTLGMEARTVSGYTGTATGGYSAYRVTYSGASSDSELCEGREIYTRAGSGALTKNSIVGTMGDYIFLSSAADGTTAIYLGPSNAIITDAIPDENETASASGEYNMVCGEASSADGAYNVVFGGDTHVSGTDNKVFGDNSTVSGTGNLVNGQSNYVLGNDNTVADGLNIVVGIGNIALRQGAILIGDRNTAAAVSVYGFGWGNTIKAYGGMAFGTSNKVNGKWSVSVGFRNKIDAESAYVVGRYADIPDAAENKNGFFIWGGHNDDNALAFSVRVFRAELNPLFNGAALWAGCTANDPNPKDSNGERKYNSVPAYWTEYKGQLKPTTQTIAVSGTQTVTLDPTMYSRVMLTGSGTVTFDIEDWAEDGDKIQLVFDSNGITPVFPAAWVTLGADVSTNPGLYVLEIAKVGTTIFYKVLYPDSQGGGSGKPGASAYEVALANGFTGTEAEWIESLKGDTGAQGPKGDKGDTGATGPQGEKGDKGDTGSVQVVVSTTAPENPSDGMIWIYG